MCHLALVSPGLQQKTKIVSVEVEKGLSSGPGFLWMCEASRRYLGCHMPMQGEVKMPRGQETKGGKSRQETSRSRDPVTESRALIVDVSGLEA